MDFYDNPWYSGFAREDKTIDGYLVLLLKALGIHLHCAKSQKGCDRGRAQTGQEGRKLG